MIGGIFITKEEALARLADGEMLTVHIEKIPNTGTTNIEEWSREDVLGRIHNNDVFESGAMGQQRDYGIHLHVICYSGPQGPGILRIFLPTKPECRLTAQQLEESLARKKGANLFSHPTITTSE